MSAPEHAIDATCLVIDDGLFVHVAEALARGFAKTLYGTALRGTSPKACHASIGVGLTGVTRVRDVYEAAEKADVIVFPDVYTADLADMFRRAGKAVFGASTAVAELELDRWKTRRLIQDAGLPVLAAKYIQGVDALAEHLRKVEDKWVKGIRYRGDVETFHHLDWFRSKGQVRRLQDKLGPAGATQEFVVEDSLPDAVEVGLDAALVDGDLPPMVSFGYEDKGAGYVGQALARKLPTPIDEVITKFRPVLRDRKATTWFSAEIRVTKDGVPYFTDPACRCGLPPSESYMELFDNWPEFVFQGARGKLIDLHPVAKYSAQIQLTSNVASDYFLAWDGTDKWTKLQNHFRQNGIDYNCPNGDTLVGAATAIANTADEALELARKRASKLKADSLDYDEGAIDRLRNTVAKGAQHGIEW